ncbi:MAG: FecR domain-containing protein [Parasphingorhabdus sp.]
MQGNTMRDVKKFTYSWLALLLCAAISVPVLAQPQSDNPRAEYKFKRGDTLIELAQKYCRKPSDYRIVQRLNRIRDPHRISVGKKVSIPFHLLKYRKSQANLSAFRGSVSIASMGKTLAPVKGLDLDEGSQLSTAAGSFLTIQLEDGSRISMPSNSKVRITRLRHILLTDSVDYELAVDRGRLRSKVTPFGSKPGRYKVRTPVSVSAVRGTDYRTRVDDIAGIAFSETVEGAIEVAAGDNVVGVPKGTGARANNAGETVTAKLLSAPELMDPAKVQSDETLSFAITPSDLAVGHRVVVSSDAGFIDIVTEQKQNSGTVTLAGIPNGRYFAKATAISSEGFEGMPSTYSFKRLLNTVSGSAEQDEFGYKFKWSGQGSGKRLFRFQLLKGNKTAVAMVDETDLTVDSITLSDLPDGDYYWRVGVTQFTNDAELGVSQKWTEFEKLTVAS